MATISAKMQTSFNDYFIVVESSPRDSHDAKRGIVTVGCPSVRMSVRLTTGNGKASAMWASFAVYKDALKVNMKQCNISSEQ